MTKPKTPQPSIDGLLITAKEVCRLAGVSDRTVTSWVNGGVLKKVDRFHYPLAESIIAIVEHFKEARKTKSSNDAAQELTRLKIQEMEIKIKTRNRELVPVDEAKECISFINSICAREFSMIAPAAFPRDLESRAKVEAVIDDCRERIAAAMTAALKSGFVLTSTIRGAESREREILRLEEIDDDDE